MQDRRFGLPHAYRSRTGSAFGGVFGRDQLMADTKATDMLLANGAAPASAETALPVPYNPAVVDGSHVGITETGASFLVIGDSGGIVNDRPQLAVAQAMDAEFATPQATHFVWHNGDIVYYNGDPDQFLAQFYEPYAHIPVPIIGIPGNHDGDSSDRVPGSGLASFMLNFCASQPGAPPADPHLEFGRRTQAQPSHDWGLVLPKVTILGVWDNVPSGGHLYPQQQQWLAAAIRGAPTDRPLILSCHHPVYSVDSHHGGSSYMLATLDAIFSVAERWPELIMSGHVHDYQRFTRTVADGVTVTYLVQGNSGYRNLHAISSDVIDGTSVAPGVVLDYADASEYGYTRLTIDGMTIHGEYTGVTEGSATNLPPQITPRKDTF